jgi:uncharacterized tellurite resistance protein B-like protein
MIDVVKKFFSKATTEVSKDANQNTAHDIRVATCALFVEIARIDEKFTDAEMETILSILKEKYGRKIRPIPGSRRRPDCRGRKGAG